MRMLLQLLPLLLLITSTSAQCPNLIWSDEFDGTDLDDSKWSPMIGDGCTLGVCGWGNAEIQQYQASNIEVSDGTLKIEARFDTATQQYTSARIRTLGKADFDLTKPIRIETRAKVPKNSKGLWPAFWMLPSNVALNTWPRYGEIDILEFIGREPNHTFGVHHYGNLWNDKSAQGSYVEYPEHAGEDFRVFAVDKTPDTLTFSVDGFVYSVYTKDEIERKFVWPHENIFHLILNLAIGGHWPEYPDETTVFPNVFEVDYVRVYDLATSSQLPMPNIVGETLVHSNQQGVQYCIDVGSLAPHDDFDSYIEWSVPAGASFQGPPSDGSDIGCITVDFGSSSGYVEANVYFNCGESKVFRMPIEVQAYYGAEFSFLVPDWAQDEASYVDSTGNYAIVEATEDEPPMIVYTRDIETVYDYIQLSTANIFDPNDYILSNKKFYMDAWSESVAPCTRIWIQLEDSTVANPSNYPEGRHSRYLAYLNREEDWTRLIFDFLDQPDTSVTNVDRILILPDTFVLRSDTYYFRNFVSAVAGCQNLCEPLLANDRCIAAKSEAGACADGINNDGVGWNGDGPVDCDDSDCWDDPVCLAEPSTPSPTPAVEICNDGIDNDGDGLTDCESLDCATSAECGSWYQPECSAYSACADIVGDCCPNPLGDYRECCFVEEGDTPSPTASPTVAETPSPTTAPIPPPTTAESPSPTTAPIPLPTTDETPSPTTTTAPVPPPTTAETPSPTTTTPTGGSGALTPKSCAVHSACEALGLTGNCCETGEGVFLDCCAPQLCESNPRCSGLVGESCCPTAEGVFLDCCEDRPETCQIHPQCQELGLTGECCPTPDGVFLDCCEPRSCDLHPACAGEPLVEDCCPTPDGVYLDCCNLDTPAFDGFTTTIVSSQLKAEPSMIQLEAEASSGIKMLLLSSLSSAAAIFVAMLLTC